MKTYPRILCVTALLLLSSCATPASRIKLYPDRFAKLNQTEQGYASEGRIQPGMTEDGVFLAWGEPSRVYNGENEKNNFADWVYMSTQPVYMSDFASRYGYGDFCDPFYDLYWDPRVDYIRVPNAVVRFENGIVKTWRRAR